MHCNPRRSVVPLDIVPMLSVGLAVAACSGQTNSSPNDAGPIPMNAGEVPGQNDAETTRRGDDSSAAAEGADASPSPPDAFVSATLGPGLGASGAALCGYGSRRQVLAIGVGVAPQPLTQADGSTQVGGNVSLACAVAAGFQVTLLAGVSGSQGATLQISGHVDSSGGSGISASFASSGGNYDQSDCTVAFTYNGSPVPATPPVAPGRIWAHLACPSARSSSGRVRQLPDGTTMSETCDLEADFFFENCSQ